MKQKILKAFTLVELIIVIVILTILSTLAFVSFSNYTNKAKQTQVLISLTQVEKPLINYFVQTGKYPLPDSLSEVTLSGVTSSYQGKIGTNLTEILHIQGKNNQIYYTTAGHRKGYQLLSELPNSQTSFIKNTFANQNQYISIGNKVGYLFLQDGSIPSVGITEFNSFSSGSVKYVLNADTIITDISQIKENLQYSKNCKRLQETGIITKNGIYNIAGSGGLSLPVFCNNEFDDGGWTLLASIPGESKVFADRTSTGIWKTPQYSFSLPNILESKEYLSPAYEQLTTNEILLCYQNSTTCYNFKHNKNIPLYNFFRDNISHVEYVNDIVGYTDTGNLDNVKKFFSIISNNTQAPNSICNFFGINYRRNNETPTGLVIGYGGDNDGPCISRNNNSTSTLDNFALGIGGNIRPYGQLTSLASNPKYVPAGVSTYSIPNSTLINIETTVGWHTSYVSKNWFIFGR